MIQTNSIPGASSNFIDLPTAIAMTYSYRTNRETILDTLYKNQDILPFSETFNKAAIESLLSQQGCEALRLYYGMDEENKVHGILVAVDENNEDILASQVSEDPDIIVELAQRCPDLCPPPSPLNN